MATKKSASKKTAGTDAGAAETPAVKTAAKKTTATTATPIKTPATKTAAKKTTEKTTEKTTAAQVSATGTQEHGAEKKSGKAHPSHHDISVRAYLLWERDGKKHGHHDHYWKQAEQELAG